MRIGTRSVLYGAHCFFIHPWFVAWGWWKLYGFPWDPRLWFAFFLHDIGYLGKPNMDGPEGEEHPRLGANIMYHLFGQEWWEFCMYHSRYFAKQHSKPFSRLCVADKLAICLEPSWLYLPRVIATGEVKEYMSANKVHREIGKSRSIREWHSKMIEYMLKWVEEHKDGREDTWTNADRSDMQ